MIITHKDIKQWVNSVDSCKEIKFNFVVQSDKIKKGTYDKSFFRGKTKNKGKK
jgi:hypothetical protein